MIKKITLYNRRGLLLGICGIVMLFLIAHVSLAIAEKPAPYIAGTDVQAHGIQAQLYTYQNPTPTASPTPAASLTPTTSPVSAVSPSQTEPFTVQDVHRLSDAHEATFTFQDLGQPTFMLRFPAESITFSVRFPYRWAMNVGTGNNYIDLRYDLVYQGSSTTVPDPESLDPVTIGVLVDGERAAYFSQTIGTDYYLRIPIPDIVFRDPPNNIYTFEITYTNRGDCRADNSANLYIHGDSSVHLGFDIQPPALTLADFPRPVLNDSFLPEKVLIVLPDQHTTTDLTAAATVSWTLGVRARRNVEVEMITATEALRRQEDFSMVVIGKPSDNVLLQQLYDRALLPTTLSSEDGQAIIAPDDIPIKSSFGVLQLAHSDSNPRVFYLVVTGKQDDALLKAASALADTIPLYALRNDLAVIDEFTDAPTTAHSDSTQHSFTLEELGLDGVEMLSIGIKTDSVTLSIPSNWVIHEDPTFELTYIHSSQLSAGESGLIVSLDDSPIGDAPIRPEIPGVKRITLTLPREQFTPGRDNLLSFTLITEVDGACIAHNHLGAWMRILKNSTLHIPVTITENVPVTFTDPLSHLFYLSDETPILLVLPDNPSQAELDSILLIARMIGDRRKGISVLEVIEANEYDQERYASHHLLIIGLPTTNSLITTVNDELPQAFFPDGNMLKQPLWQTAYQIPSDFSVGLVEVIPNPNNSKRAITVVTGTTQLGLSWALNAIISPKLAGRMSHDINFMNEEIIQSLDSKMVTEDAYVITVEDIITQQELTATTAALSTPLPGTSDQPLDGTLIPDMSETIVFVPTSTPTVVHYTALPNKYEPTHRELSEPAEAILAILISVGGVLIGSGIIIQVGKFLRNRW